MKPRGKMMFKVITNTMFGRQFSAAQSMERLPTMESHAVMRTEIQHLFRTDLEIHTRLAQEARRRRSEAQSA
jgi:hypothetical protein